jgi:hypothetical protein
MKSDSRSWIECAKALPKNGEVVQTKIDDEKGLRNEQALKRQNSLWFFPDGSMYVYYRPTHWRPTQ